MCSDKLYKWFPFISCRFILLIEKNGHQLQIQSSAWNILFHSTTWTFLHRITTIHAQKQPPEVFYKKGVLESLTKFTGKRLCQSLFFIKLEAWGFIKKRLWHRCFPVNFEKCLRTLPWQNTSEWLLLHTDSYLDRHF